MPFILRIHSYRNQPPATPVSRRFDALGGSIGRTPDNDLVLNDPSKAISRKHARIECRDGNFYLIDTGSNPSLVNGLPLSSGKEARLTHGARITIGDYELEAVFEDVPVAAAAVAAPMQSTAGLPPATPPLYQPAPPAKPIPSNAFVAEPLLGGTVDTGLPPLAGQADPLGLSLFGGIKPDPLSPAYRGAESDHLPPEHQAFPVQQAAVAAIPDDYDPLADCRSVSAAGIPSTVGPVHGTSVDGEVLQALLRGLGLPGLQTGRSAPELAELAGTLLREAVTGVMGVLVARAMTKRESRIDMTVMAAQANNPLKFFPDAQSALKQMLTNELPGYMSASKAIGVAFDDIKAHELAVMAGMRAALSGVLQRFNPEEIERQAQAKGASVMDSMLPVNRKAKMWDQLVELYAEVERQADDDFQRLFGERFSAAYQEQVERLRSVQHRQGGTP